MADDRPSCFGIPDKCMPRDEDGIIQPQEACRCCDHLRECLQDAIAAGGGVGKMKSGGNSEHESSTKPGGIAGKILRWSERKRAAQKGGTS